MVFSAVTVMYCTEKISVLRTIGSILRHFANRVQILHKPSQLSSLLYSLHQSNLTTVELQWLEHYWLVYHGCFELVLESLGRNLIAADLA